MVTTLAGSTYDFADGTGAEAYFKSPSGVAVDAVGTVYVAEFDGHKIRKITTGDILTGDTTGHAGTHNIVLRVIDAGGLSTEQTFTITVKDVLAPTVTSTLPANNATQVALDSNLELTFNENIKIGTGNILLKKASDDSIVETIAINITDKTLTINPTADLESYTKYYITIDATAITDMADNAFAGFADNSTWTFTSFQRPFITIWETTTANEEIVVPTESSQTYNYTINWGDGTIDTNETGNGYHTYLTPGMHTVEITGDFPAIYFYDEDDDERNKIRDIKQWGAIKWKTFYESFYECSNLTSTAVDVPDLSEVTNMQEMFYNASSFNGDVSNWNVSNVTNMEGIFYNASSFNGDVSSWDVSNVTNMYYMFEGASVFNRNLSAWDVSNVTDMRYMFSGASSFNGDVSSWDVSNVTNMKNLFNGASVFNGDLSAWDVSKVTNMEGLFNGATAFNGDVSNWDVSNVTNMKNLFIGASVFNGDLSAWDVSKVTNMEALFKGATAFNQDISSWDVSNVTTMDRMFSLTDIFNQDLSSWDVSKVINISGLFYGAKAFNGNISNWNVSNITRTEFMFSDAKAFNQDISGWNVGNVTSMRFMFNNARVFNQNLSEWDISKVTNMEYMLSGTALSTNNYDNTLIGWLANTNTPSGLTLGANGLNYCKSLAARNLLIQDNTWTIIGDVLKCAPTITSVAVPQGNKSYKTGDILIFTATYDLAVTASSTIQLPFTIGNTLVKASLSTATTSTNTNSLVFHYTVLEGEEDTDGISIGAAVTLELNGGSIVETADVNTNALLELNNVASLYKAKVDGIKPAAAIITSLINDTDTGIFDDDAITKNQYPHFTGTAEAGSLVNLYIGSRNIGSARTSGSGVWKFEQVAEYGPTAEGIYDVTSITTDVAGNASETSTVFKLVIDTLQIPSNTNHSI